MSLALAQKERVLTRLVLRQRKVDPLELRRSLAWAEPIPAYLRLQLIEHLFEGRHLRSVHQLIRAGIASNQREA